MASHSALQYLPSVTWQLQIGCSHFLVAMLFSPRLRYFWPEQSKHYCVTALAHPLALRTTSL